MDLLDQLIFDARSPKRIKVAQEAINPFRDPTNWKENRIVLLLHNHTKESIGYFQELLFRGNINIRRLVRIPEPSDPAALVDLEIVDGPVWEGKSVRHLVDPPTEGELAMLRAKWIGRTFRPAWKHLGKPGIASRKNIDVDALLKEVFSL